MNKVQYSGLLLGAWAAGGFAQAATPTGSGDDLQEIVVTAERVANTESKTPVSMEVIDQQELLRKGIVDVQSLARPTLP